MNSERYQRQACIPEIGEEGQAKLADSSVLVIGVGGLGTTVLYTLAGAGVGTIGLADHEIVKNSNLNRQFIHFEKDVGSLKVTSAARKLKSYNSDINIIPIDVAINKDNVYEIISQYDIVVLAVDNAAVKMLVNNACVELNKPLVDGSVNAFVGAVTFVEPHKTPCLACLYGGKELPPEEHFSSLSPVVSSIASLQATTVLQHLLGLNNPLYGQIATINAMTAEYDKTPLVLDPDCPVCSKTPEEHERNGLFGEPED